MKKGVSFALIGLMLLSMITGCHGYRRVEHVTPRPPATENRVARAPHTHRHDTTTRHHDGVNRNLDGIARHYRGDGRVTDTDGLIGNGINADRPMYGNRPGRTVADNVDGVNRPIGGTVPGNLTR
ncbi:MAG: hypothetical protein FWD99_06615 [Oscillospiraceae bacterium]|nr:hypothetical protein [Oscillospiraceae bacterium]